MSRAFLKRIGAGFSRCAGRVVPFLFLMVIAAAFVAMSLKQFIGNDDPALLPISYLAGLAIAFAWNIARRYFASEDVRSRFLARAGRIAYFVLFASRFPNEKTAAVQAESAAECLTWPYGVRVLSKVSVLALLMIVGFTQLLAVGVGAYLGWEFGSGIFTLPSALAGMLLGFVACNWALALPLRLMGWILRGVLRLLAAVFRDERKDELTAQIADLTRQVAKLTGERRD